MYIKLLRNIDIAKNITKICLVGCALKDIATKITINTQELNKSKK